MANEEGARGFAVLLQSVGDGAFHVEVSEMLLELNTKLARHAEDFGKAKGTIAVTLTVDIDREGVVTVDPDVKIKTPKPARKKGRYWLTQGNNLSPENPKQQKLPLREVPAQRTRAVEPREEPAPRGV